MMSGATKDLGTTWFVVPAVVPFRATPHAHWPAPLDHFDWDFGADKPPRPGIHPQRRQDPGLPYWAPKLQGDADATLAWRWPRPGHDKAGQSKRKCEPQNESNESLHSLPPSPPAKAGVLESWLVD